MSYAFPDRAKVLRYAHAYDMVNVKYYLDRVSNLPGEMWEKRTYEEIRNSDLFLLFWSRHAQKSDWVIKEAEYALKYSKSLSVPRRKIFRWAWAHVVRR